MEATTGAGAEPVEPVVGVTTETGAEPVEPFFFMGASAAQLVGAKAARHASFLSSLLMCPIAPDELDAFSGRYRLLLPLGEQLQLLAEHR